MFTKINSIDLFATYVDEDDRSTIYVDKTEIHLIVAYNKNNTIHI